MEDIHFRARLHWAPASMLLCLIKFLRCCFNKQASHSKNGLQPQSIRYDASVMAYFHQRTRIRTRIRIANPMGTLYYAKLFPLVWIRTQIPVWRVSRMVTVPILGTDLRPRDRSLSLFHTFESGEQSPNLNQWKNLHRTGIWIESESESVFVGGNEQLMLKLYIDHWR